MKTESKRVFEAAKRMLEAERVMGASGARVGSTERAVVAAAALSARADWVRACDDAMSAGLRTAAEEARSEGVRVWLVEG